jgi:DNA-binding transcriptional LysR family regulator
MLDYRYLKAFLLTARFSSFSKAAEHLKIAQSAVSRQIKLLEEGLSEELIIRSSKKVVLTHKGEEFFKAAQHFDKMAEDIFKKEDTRPIRIGLLHGLLKNWLAPRLIRYYKKSKRNIEIHVGDRKTLREGIENNRYDIIFSTENIQSELISSLKLFDERLVLISKEEINKKKLHEYRWVVYGEEDNLFRVSKRPSENITIVEDIHTIVDLVKNHIGIAVVPDHVLKKTDALVVNEIPISEKSEIYMTTLNYKSIPEYIKEISLMAQK